MRLSVGEDTTHSPLRSINLGVYVQNLQIHNYLFIYTKFN